MFPGWSHSSRPSGQRQPHPRSQFVQGLALYQYSVLLFSAMEPEAEPAQNTFFTLRSICQETHEDHEALPSAPSGIPANMTFVTMTVKSCKCRCRDSHTFAGQPDQVNAWLKYMCKAHSLARDSFLIVFKEGKNFEWGESVSISRTGFLPGRHYRVTADRQQGQATLLCAACECYRTRRAHRAS